MRYLVIAEGIDVTVPTTPAEAADFLEAVVVPSEELLAKLEADGRIYGGSFAARRGGAAVVEAESNDDLNALLTSIPIWGFSKFDVIPLQTFESRAAQDASSAKALRAFAG